MTIDLHHLSNLIAKHGPVTRVLVVDAQGSTPRDAGAQMYVWGDNQWGTIGGGALEYSAAHEARGGKTGISRHPLGPDLGQCCGGAVTLAFEHFATAPICDNGFYLRNLGGQDRPLAIERNLQHIRNGTTYNDIFCTDGWVLEPVKQPQTPLWIWGAGHVGRAIVSAISDMPDYDITWVDTDIARFPQHIPSTVTAIPAQKPEMLMAHAPQGAMHLILTYSHVLDLALCHGALARGFAFCGVIGSATKWVRFRKRLHAMGHTPSAVNRITCPIGDPSLGKHPQAIAVSVIHSILTSAETHIYAEKGHQA